MGKKRYNDHIVLEDGKWPLRFSQDGQIVVFGDLAEAEENKLENDIILGLKYKNHFDSEYNSVTLVTIEDMGTGAQVGCFTHRTDDEDGFFEGLDEWFKNDFKPAE